ncbi:MAG: hypothetical protein R3F60_09025 [bacterium]
MLERWSGWLCMALLASFGLVGCDDEEAKGGGCASDSQCERGSVCEDGACAIIQCTGIGSCPGSGRTCLLDLRQCSPKECADAVNGAELACPPERSICLESGAFRASCVASLPCEDTSDCGGIAGLTCCGGECRADCPDQGVIPVQDMSVPMPDAGPPTDMGPPRPDQGMTSTGELCSPCRGDGDCAPLGDGARCTPLGGDGAFCASACAGANDCPAGYQCVDGLGLCLPVDLRCVACLQTPCAAGSVCDTRTGDCVEPQGVCGSCTGADGCRQGLTCAPLGGRQYCFEPCQNGACGDESLACEDGLCKPVGGRCDACGGSCRGDTPYCIEAEARCGQCGPGSPCPEGLSCDLANYACVERDGCLGDIDCQAPTPVCFNGGCVACLQDTDCPARNACNAMQQCEPDPCRGVECQRGSQCDAQAGRCSPGCNADADCVDNTGQMRPMTCNVETGQCFFNSGVCDVGQGDGVCAPGSTCTPSFLDPNLGVCDCALSDPMNPMSAPRIACQPGQGCLQFLPDLPGCCGSCGLGI